MDVLRSDKGIVWGALTVDAQKMQWNTFRHNLNCMSKRQMCATTRMRYNGVSEKSSEDFN